MKNKIINLFSDNKILEDTGVKYAELLEEFIVPFSKEFIHKDYFEEVIDFGVKAWNMANINTCFPKSMFDKAFKSIDIDDGEVSLFNKMITYKMDNFNSYTNFIIEFELKEDIPGNNPKLSLLTQESEAYLAIMKSEIDEVLQNTQEEYEENYINRTAIILRPKKRFLDWVNTLNPEIVFGEDIKETKTYLVNDSIDIDKWLKKEFDKIFMMELTCFSLNKKDWPQKRSYNMFKLWFRVEVSEMINDLDQNPIGKL